ncbi:MAG: helix-turn-helix domain-containing protein [Pseudomonadota bacterium]
MTDKDQQSLGSGAQDRLDEAVAADTAGAGRDAPSGLFDMILRRASRVAGGTLDLAMDVATAGAMFGDYRIRDLLASSASPERLEAMAEAGRFLRDARETAGLSVEELAERLELQDDAMLSSVEEGRSILPLELVLRTASLLARHDPVPFLIKFLRSYNPGLEAKLEQWGVMALPRNFERERRFINLYRQHDFLRDLSDDEYQRFIEYMDASTNLVVEVMQREGAAPAAGRSKKKAKARTRKSSPRRSASKTGSDSGQSPGPQAAQKRGSGSPDGDVRRKPVVRKVKPRNLGS